MGSGLYLCNLLGLCHSLGEVPQLISKGLGPCLDSERGAKVIKLFVVERREMVLCRPVIICRWD